VTPGGIIDRLGAALVVAGWAVVIVLSMLTWWAEPVLTVLRSIGVIG
jgi:hypothetical protein